MIGAELLALHRELVRIPSVSHNEGPIASFLESFLRERGVEVHRHNDNVFALCGDGPLLCLNSHLDTVPASTAWKRPPHEPAEEDGRIYGLGSNDAKASVAAMIAALLRIAQHPSPGVRVLLALVAGEEVGGKGTEALLPLLQERGLMPDAVIVGEPTGLDIVTSQKGLMVLELVARGQACHAAHARSLNAPNPIFILASDLHALERIELPDPDSELGAITVEPTVLSAGSARNMVPNEATCILDVRTNPEPSPAAIAALLQNAVQSEVRVLSDRLRPCSVDRNDPIVLAARHARPEANLTTSRGVSDWVFFKGIPGIKAGPGRTERSHTPDEFVLASEVIEAADFYERTALVWGLRTTTGDAA